MKSNWKRISALVLSLALLLCAAVPAMAESAAKDETVYILSDAQGQARRDTGMGVVTTGSAGRSARVGRVGPGRDAAAVP